MDSFSLSSGIHIVSLLAATIVIVLITKVVFAVFPVQTDRRRVINSLTMLVFFILLNYVNVFVHLPWFSSTDYYSALHVGIAIFATMLFTSSLDFFIWHGIAIRGGRPGVPSVLTNMLKSLIYFVVFVACANIIYGMQLTALLAATGLLTFVLGYAAQSTMSNFFAGIAIQLGGKLKKGMHIEAAGYDGIISDFNWRSVTLSGFRKYVVPNSSVANSSIVVFGKQGEKRYKDVTLTVSANSDIPKAVEISKKVMKDCSIYNDAASYFSGYDGIGANILALGMVSERSHCWPLVTEFTSAVRSVGYKNGVNFSISRTVKDTESLAVFPPQQPLEQTVLDAVKKDEVFSDLSDDAIAKIASISQLQFYALGENVINQNEPGSSMFIVVEGDFSTYEFHEDKRNKMRDLAVSDVFGLKAFLMSEPRRITVRSHSIMGWALEVERDAFKTIMDDHPEILERLSAILVERETQNAIKHQELDDAAMLDQDISKVIMAKIGALFKKPKEKPEEIVHRKPSK